MPAVQQSRQTLPCVKCGHTISVERVGDAVVVKSTSRGWVRCVVFHLEHLTRGGKPDTTTLAGE